MRRTDLTHREAAMVHAIRRAWQRLGLALCESEVNEIAGFIRGKSEVLAEGDNGNRLHCVRYRDRDVYAVFSPELDAIVSFLPSPAYFRPKGEDLASTGDGGHRGND